MSTAKIINILTKLDGTAIIIIIAAKDTSIIRHIEINSIGIISITTIMFINIAKDNAIIIIITIIGITIAKFIAIVINTHILHIIVNAIIIQVATINPIISNNITINTPPPPPK